MDAATGPAGHPQLPSAAAPAGRPDVHKTATIENDQQGCKGNGGTRSQAIPHGVSTLKSRLVAGHRAEPFPQGTVRPWKRWWCGGRPITGPYLLKGLPFPLVSCPHAKGRREVFPPRVTAVRAVLITCGIIQPSCSSEDPRLPTFHSQDLPTPGVGRVCGRVRLTPDDNYCPHAEAAPGPNFP